MAEPLSVRDLLRGWLGIELLEAELATHAHEGGGGNGSEPHEHAERVITMFEPEDVKVFVKDENITPQLSRVGGELRGTNLTMWLDDPDGRLDSKDFRFPITFIPQKILNEIKFGGVGPLMRGSATVSNNDGKDNSLAACTWVRASHAENRMGVVVLISPDKSPRLAALKPDYPWNSQQGTHVRLTIALP